MVEFIYMGKIYIPTYIAGRLAIIYPIAFNESDTKFGKWCRSLCYSFIYKYWGGGRATVSFISIGEGTCYSFIYKQGGGTNNDLHLFKSTMKIQMQQISRYGTSVSLFGKRLEHREQTKYCINTHNCFHKVISNHCKKIEVIGLISFYIPLA